jgi:hypothetical protein
VRTARPSSGSPGSPRRSRRRGKPYGIRVCVLYPGAMATACGTFEPGERGEQPAEASAVDRVLPPGQVAPQSTAGPYPGQHPADRLGAARPTHAFPRPNSLARPLESVL